VVPRVDSPAEEALALLRQYSAGNIEFVVPDLFWAEFGNILWKCVRKDCISAKWRQTP
jgi:hypothetical protein